MAPGDRMPTSSTSTAARRRATPHLLLVLSVVALVLGGTAAPVGAHGPQEVPNHGPWDPPPTVLPDAGVPDPVPAPGEGSALVGCDQAGVRGQLSADVHLDPSCTYTAGFDIVASGVTLDCQGALLDGTGRGGAGVLVHTPIDVTLTDVRIRNCRVHGFLNGMKVTRDGFRTLEEGREWHRTLRDVLIEHSELGGSHGVGIFVDGYVERVTVRNVAIIGAGSTGIYMDGGSRRNTLRDNVLHDNGFTENGREEGQVETFNGVRVRWWGPGREGISVDGSSENVVVGNHLRGNSAGGIFLYTNCGEYPSRVDRWYDRRTPSDDNLIEGNTVVEGRHGIWVGSRMAENTYPMECSKPTYHQPTPLERYVLDMAKDNTIRGNQLHGVTYGIQVEDDGTVVEGNTFTGPNDLHHAIVIGTKFRTEVLGHPVRDTVVRDNHSMIEGSTHPFRWVHGHEHTVVEGNTAMRRPTELCEGAELPRNPFVMFHIAVPEPEGTGPTPKPDYDIPVLGSLPSCGSLPDVVPDAPADAAAAALGSTARVTWTAPVDDGGRPVERYDVLDAGGAVVASTRAPITRADVIGLGPGATASFTVVAHNELGASTPSAATAPVTVGSSPPFADVDPAGPFAGHIAWMADTGTALGSDGAYLPAQAVRRQELAALLHRLAGAPTVALPTTPTFTDVGSEHPFATPIEWLATTGAALGDDGRFDPTRPVTRAELAALLHRLAGAPTVALPTTATFTDVGSEHPFATPIEWLATTGIAAGWPDGTFRPSITVARQEVAPMLHRSTQVVTLEP